MFSRNTNGQAQAVGDLGPRCSIGLASPDALCSGTAASRGSDVVWVAVLAHLRQPKTLREASPQIGGLGDRLSQAAVPDGPALEVIHVPEGPQPCPGVFDHEEVRTVPFQQV